jgi:hypothetical protein
LRLVTQRLAIVGNQIIPPLILVVDRRTMGAAPR